MRALIALLLFASLLAAQDVRTRKEGQSRSLTPQRVTSGYDSSRKTSTLPAGLYRVSVLAATTRAGVAGTLSVALEWNGSSEVVVNAMLLTNARTSAQAIRLIRLTGATHLTYSTTVTGALGAPLYSLDIITERIGP